jgi:tripartite-type tricarboxylate transporter receptor subunit TctC
MQLPDVQKRLETDAIETRLFSPEEFTRFIEAETALWAPLAREIAASQK